MNCLRHVFKTKIKLCVIGVKLDYIVYLSLKQILHSIKFIYYTSISSCFNLVSLIITILAPPPPSPNKFNPSNYINKLKNGSRQDNTKPHFILNEKMAIESLFKSLKPCYTHCKYIITISSEL